MTRGARLIALLLAMLTSACEAPPLEIREPPTNVSVAPDPFEAVATLRWVAGGIDDLGDVQVAGAPTLRGAFGPGGSVLVIDRPGAQLFLIDSAGQRVMTLGRRGEGPGEFSQWLSDGGFVGDSLLWVYDSRLRRITWFDLEGEFVATRTSEAQTVPGTPLAVMPTVVLEGGRLFGGAVPGSPEWSEVAHPLPFWNGTGGDPSIADSIRSSVPSANRVLQGANGASVRPQVIYRGAPLLRVATGGHWVFVLQRGPETAESAVATITRYSPEGTVLDTVRIPYEPVPVSDSEHARIRVIAERAAAGTPPGSGIRTEDVLAHLWIPEHLPPFRDARADSAGFWLQKYPEGPSLTTTWLRYDLAGQLQGRATLPTSAWVMDATPTSFLTQNYDSLNVTIVRMYDLEPGTPEAGPEG